MKKILSFFSLVASLSTLICCALPALFVTLGFGAVLAGIVGNVPQLIWISEHKNLVFVLAGSLLLLNAIFQLHTRELACPIDQDLREACMHARKYSRIILLFSIILFFIGAFFAFIAPMLFS